MTLSLIHAARVVCVALLAAPLVAQHPAEPEASPLQKQASAAYAARDWPAAVELFAQLVEEQPGDAQAWHDYGYALHLLARYDEALAADQRAAEKAAEGSRVKATSTYNVACALSMLGRKDEAIDWLQKAAAAGFRNAGMMNWDPELAPVRGEQRFADFMAELLSHRRKVAILIYEGVELLDFSGPAEVFADASGEDGLDGYEVLLVAPTHDAVKPNGVGGRIVPQCSIDDCPEPDVVVLPGGETGNVEDNPAVMAWLERVAPRAQVMMSVCNGAFVYAQLGLLDGLPATTHSSMTRALARDFPAVQVREGVRFVDNGHVITTAGISAGIDGALQVVRRQMGDAAAASTARGMDYAWQPD